MSTSEGRAFIRQVFGEPSELSFRDQVLSLREKYGSNVKAARAAGVGEATVRRWLRGQATPKPASRDRVEAAVREIRTAKAPSDDRAQFTVVSYEPRRRNPDRTRTTRPGALKLTPGTMAKARTAYVATGDPDAALKVFLAGVQEPFYKSNLTPAEWRTDGSATALPASYPMSLA